MKTKRTFRNFVLAGLLFFGAPALLQAEYRSYRSQTPPGKLIPKLIQSMGDAGFQFRVQKVFNEQRDGRQGFVFVLQPRSSFCELSIYDAGKNSLVRVFTQDVRDSRRFHRFFVETMKMAEVDSTPEEKMPPNDWPVPR